MTDPRPAVLFDIDGTLVDSNYLHVETWGRAFAELGLPVDAWRIHRAIGLDSSLMLDATLGDRKAAHGDDAKKLHSRYYEQLAPRLRPFEGVHELLRALRDRGVATVLATSAPENELAMLRKALDVDDLVDAMTSADDVDTAKPEPDVIHAAVGKASSTAQRAFLIGDTVWDARAAARAGVRTIGVLSGGISEAELVDAGAVAVYENVAALLGRLDESPLAELWA